MKKTVIGVLFLLVLSAALIVSCSQNAGENAAVGEELVDISFSTMTSRALTATREDFDEKEYVWKYEAVKDDATGLTTGQTTSAQYVVPGGKTVGLKGNTITGLSQGYWNFTLYAYKAIKEGETVTGHSNVYSYKGTVTHQKVVKGSLAEVKVTVSPNMDGYGSISFSKDIVLKTLGGDNYSSFTGDVRMGFGVKKYGTDTPIDSSEWTNLKAGTYVVTVQVYYKDDPGIVFATESKIVTVYTGLNTEIGGNVGELSAGIQFGDVTAEIIEATSPVIDKDTKTSVDVEFQSSGTIEVTASLPGSTAVALLDIEEGKTKEMTLTLEIQSEEATVTEQQTSKVYDISLMQTTVTKDNTTGAVSSDVGIIKNLSDSTEKHEDYYLTATLTIDAGLDNVSVTHSTLPMKEFTGAAPDYSQDEKEGDIWKGFYKYDKSTGDLTIVTRSFSPFKVFYTEPTVVTYPVAVYDSSGDLVSGYSTVQAAVDAAAAGQTVKLLADVDLAAQVVVDKELILDLNGKKIYNTKDIWDNADAWSLISVQGKGALTITGKGTLDAKENDCYAIDVRDIRATLVVENGTIVGNIHAIYAYEGFVTVKGGSFNIKQVYSTTQPYEFELNCRDANYNAGKANFTVTGGTFYKFNPGDNESEKGGHTDYLDDGYMAIKNSDSTYTVVKNDLFPGPGSGTKANPFRISTAEQFIAIGQLSDLMNSGNEYYFKLTDDIDLRDYESTEEYVVNLLAGYLDGKKDDESSYKIYCPLDGDVISLFRYVKDFEISNIDVILSNHTVKVIRLYPYGGEKFVFDNVDYSSLDESAYYQIAHNGSLYFSCNFRSPGSWGGQYTIKNCDVKLNLLGAKSSNSAVFVGGYIYDYAETYKVEVSNCSYEGTFRGNYVALVLSNGQGDELSFRSDFFIVTNLKNNGTLIGTGGAYAVGAQNHSGQCKDPKRAEYYNTVQETTGGQYIILNEVINASVDPESGLVSIEEAEGRKYVVSLYASRDVYNSKNEQWASNYNYSIEFGEFASTKKIFRYDFVDYDTAIAEGLILAGDCDPEKWAPTGGDFSGSGQYQIVSKDNATYYVIRFTPSDEQHYRFVIEEQKPTVMISAYDSQNNLVGIKEI